MAFHGFEWRVGPVSLWFLFVWSFRTIEINAGFLLSKSEVIWLSRSKVKAFSVKSGMLRECFYAFFLFYHGFTSQLPAPKVNVLATIWEVGGGR
jgi:hypothetical protein